MIFYVDSKTGETFGSIYGEVEQDLCGVTKLTSGSDYAVLVDPTGHVDSNGMLLPNFTYTVTNVVLVTDKQLYVPCATGTLVATPISADVLLANAKSAKMQEVTAAYQVELNGTFTSSATGTPLVYDYSPTSQELWKELSDAIAANYLPDSAFPMNITLANKTTVPHTKAQLQQIFGEIVARKFQLYGKWQSMVTANGSIMSITTSTPNFLDVVNAIKW